MKKFKININLCRERIRHTEVVDRELPNGDNITESWYRNFGPIRVKTRSWNNTIIVPDRTKKKGAIGFQKERDVNAMDSKA